MSKQNTGARLNQGNHIYLYRLLRDALGCGKQTFMTQVEEALAAGDMAAVDLGFETTRELLEELDDCIKLTVFKGGRIYATVIPNEQWDAALAKGDEPKQKDAGKKQKSWKKKKGEKALKAVRPKHVKRPEPEVPEPETAPATEAQPEAKVAAESTVETAANDAVPAEAVEQIAAETAELINSEIFSAEDEPAEESDFEAVEEVTPVEPAAAPQPEVPQPKISLTVVYDPEHANAGVTTIESTPLDAVGQTPSATEAPKADAEPAAGTESIPAAEPLSEAKPVALAESKDEQKSQAKTAVAAKVPDAKPGKQPKPKPESAPVPKSEPAAEKATPAEHESNSAPKAPTVHEAEPKPAPASKPNHAPRHEGARKPKPAPEQAAAPAASTAAVATPKPEPPKIPEDYPVDFALEVFCPGPLLHELSTYLPYGADALGIVGEYYWIARERGTIQASRNRATFPLRYTRDGKRHEVTIRIRRNTGGPGATWAIDKIENHSE